MHRAHYPLVVSCAPRPKCAVYDCLGFICNYVVWLDIPLNLQKLASVLGTLIFFVMR